MTESLDPEFLSRVVEIFFPIKNRGTLLDRSDNWTGKFRVTENKLWKTARQFRDLVKASGSNRIPGRVWALTAPEMAPRLVGLFFRCLEEAFPPSEKRASLVLFRKEGKPPDLLSAYHSLCLINKLENALRKLSHPGLLGICPGMALGGPIRIPGKSLDYGRYPKVEGETPSQIKLPGMERRWRYLWISSMLQLLPLGTSGGGICLLLFGRGPPELFPG